MKTTLYAKRAALLLSTLLICHVFQANSAPFEQNQETVFSGRNRMLRTMRSPPPAPELGRASNDLFFSPPPSLTRENPNITPDLRTVRKRSPPAPKLSGPRNFRSFLPSPPPPPPRPPPPPPPPPKAPLHRRPSNCKVAPPPPEST